MKVGERSRRTVALKKLHPEKNIKKSNLTTNTVNVGLVTYCLVPVKRDHIRAPSCKRNLPTRLQT